MLSHQGSPFPDPALPQHALFVPFGADGRGMGRIKIRFYGEIWQDIHDERVEVPHGKK